MIVPMKKVYVVMQKNRVESELKNLEQVAVVHVEHTQPPHGHHLTHLKEMIASLEQMILVLAPVAKETGQSPLVQANDMIEKFQKFMTEKSAILEGIDALNALLAMWKPWGSFNPSDIDLLARRGVYIDLYELSAKEARGISKDEICYLIHSDKNVLRYVFIAREQKNRPYKKVALPENSLVEWERELNIEKERLASIDQQIHGYAQYYESLIRELESRRDELSFEEVKVGLGNADELVYLKGFIPLEKTEAFQKAAAAHQWGIMVVDPEADDRVPTLMRNPRWINTIKPMFALINVMPGYRELDISPFFLLFFSLFVGMLIGDAGYGLIYLGLFAFAHTKLGPKLKDPTVFYLLYLLCACVILWGVLTGVYFGQLWLPQSIKPLMPWLNETNNIQMFCFLIGAVHLTIAHGWKALTLFPQRSSLSQMGWVGLVWVMFFMAKFLVLNQPLPGFVFPGLLSISVIMIVVFALPNLSPTFLLDMIGCFTDVVSYIRLYAVGIATVAVADAANQNIIFGVLVLHPLNLVLAAMAILVHGLRLNVLEFSGHLGLEWAGIKYQPFQKKQ